MFFMHFLTIHIFLGRFWSMDMFLTWLGTNRFTLWIGLFLDVSKIFKFRILAGIDPKIKNSCFSCIFYESNIFWTDFGGWKYFWHVQEQTVSRYESVCSWTCQKSSKFRILAVIDPKPKNPCFSCIFWQSTFFWTDFGRWSCFWHG